jgi:hypothetical protein
MFGQRYTSFTGCAVLLYSATQKLLMLNATETSHDLLYASSHLNLLSLCSFNSSTGRELYSMMQVVFNDIRDILVSPAFDKVSKTFSNISRRTGHIQFNTQPEEGFQETMMHIRDLARRVLNILQQRLDF